MPLTLLTAVLGLIGIIAPASASATPLDCSGATVYSVQRPLAQSSSASGIIYALLTATAGQSSVTATQVTSLPTNSFPNALGISGDGTGLYAVAQSGSSGGATVYGYSTATGTWSTYDGSGGTPSGYVAGAVDPATGIYYYADYSAGTASTPGTATLYGFDTNTNTAIPGTIATFSLPDGNGTAAQNGDFTFDTAGNLYVLASTGTIRAIGVVKAPLPTTGANATLTDTTLSSVSDTSTYNGIAFDSSGKLYLESSNAGVWSITAVDPNNGAVVSGPTAISSNAQANPDVDLASCATIPTLSTQSNVSGRASPTDQFSLSMTGGTITTGNTATTLGSSTGIQSQTAGPVIAASGTTYTISETAASGSLSNYDVTYSCVDTANGNAPVTSGNGSSFQLTFPPTVANSPAIVCSFATSLEADLAITDTALPSTVPSGGQVTYTLNVTNNGPDPATGTTADDTLPSGLTIVSATPSQGTCTTTSGINCALGTIADGEGAQVVIVASADGSTAGNVTNSASVTADETDPDSSNNTTTTAIAVSPATPSPTGPTPTTTTSTGPTPTGPAPVTLGRAPLAGVQVSPDGRATLTLVCPQTNSDCDASGVLTIQLPGTLAAQTVRFSGVHIASGQTALVAVHLRPAMVRHLQTLRIRRVKVTLKLSDHPDGGLAVNSTGTLYMLIAPLPATACPSPTGQLNAMTLGPVMLGATRGRTRHNLPRYVARNYHTDNFCLSRGSGIRVGYASTKLLGTTEGAAHPALIGKAVLALTSNRFYSLDGVRPGSSLASAARRLKLGTPSNVGRNTWYIIPGHTSNGVLKVRNHVIEEVGIGNPQLTGTRASARHLLGNF